jgi:hypothetical protein
MNEKSLTHRVEVDDRVVILIMKNAPQTRRALYSDFCIIDSGNHVLSIDRSGPVDECVHGLSWFNQHQHSKSLECRMKGIISTRRENLSNVDF